MLSRICNGRFFGGKPHLTAFPMCRLFYPEFAPEGAAQARFLTGAEPGDVILMLAEHHDAGRYQQQGRQPLAGRKQRVQASLAKRPPSEPAAKIREHRF